MTDVWFSPIADVSLGLDVLDSSPVVRRTHRSYDSRLRVLALDAAGEKIAQRLAIPRSTLADWRANKPAPLVALPDRLGDNGSGEDLHRRVLVLERRIAVLIAVVALLRAVISVCGINLDRRLPSGEHKRRLLAAITSARRTLLLGRVLTIVGISSSRYHDWRHRSLACRLDDRRSCPRRHPTQLTAAEIAEIKDVVTAPDFRHVPTGTLAVLAARLGRVFAAPGTWYRLIKARGWRRPRLRRHPAAPTEGVRATAPDQIWHIDVTVIRLLGGSKIYLQAVLDNFSRRILAWRLSDRNVGVETAALLERALEQSHARERGTGPPQLYVDGGSENFNEHVDGLVDANLLRRVLAQTDVSFSNSLIEAFWRSLKHQWMFLHQLAGIDQVRKLIEFYVAEHNETIPHSALDGRTPDEVYFGTGDDVVAKLDTKRRLARGERIAVNRAATCDACLEASPPATAAA